MTPTQVTIDLLNKIEQANKRNANYVLTKEDEQNIKECLAIENDLFEYCEKQLNEGIYLDSEKQVCVSHKAVTAVIYAVREETERELLKSNSLKLSHNRIDNDWLEKTRDGRYLLMQITHPIANHFNTHPEKIPIQIVIDIVNVVREEIK